MNFIILNDEQREKINKELSKNSEKCYTQEEVDDILKEAGEEIEESVQIQKKSSKKLLTALGIVGIVALVMIIIIVVALAVKFS